MFKLPTDGYTFHISIVSIPCLFLILLLGAAAAALDGAILADSASQKTSSMLSVLSMVGAAILTADACRFSASHQA